MPAVGALLRNRTALAIFLAILCGCTARVRSAHPVEVQVPANVKVNASAEPPQTFAPGDYRLEEKGAFRRVIFWYKPMVSYDVWRAAPRGALQHLHFVLTPPSSQALESSYRDARRTYEDIVLFRYGKVALPFSSGGRTLTELDFEQDDREIAKLRAQASKLHYYSSLQKIDRERLDQAIPKC